MTTKDLSNKYDNLSYKELVAEIRRRRLALRGGKAAMINRLVLDDRKRAASKERKPDRIVNTRGGMEFTICGGCDRWNVRCICSNENSEEPGEARTEDSVEQSSPTTSNGEGLKGRRHIHRGTFA